MAKSTNGLKVYMADPGATPTVIDPISASAAKPSALTVTSSTGILVGDLVVIDEGATGMAGLDGKSFVVSVVTSTLITLAGSDTVGQTFAAGAGVINSYGTAEMLGMCWSILTFNPNAPSAISVGTFCDPSAQLASPVVQPGTASIGGFIDILDPGYAAIIDADNDGENRQFVAYLPSNGSLVFDGSVGGFSAVTPVEGAMGWTATVTLTNKARHLF